MGKRNARRMTATLLRILCWVVVALTLQATNAGILGPGGKTFGITLAGLLATALWFTRDTRRKPRRNGRRTAR